MFRKDFHFDEFTDTSIHLFVPKDFTDRRHWRVWLREPSNGISIRARNRDDAQQIGIQLAEIIGVKYWPPPDEAIAASSEGGP
jgi:DNA mismatch repair protein MutH